MIARSVFFSLLWFLTLVLQAQQFATLDGDFNYREVSLDEYSSEFNASLPARSDFIVIENIEFEGNDETRQHILMRELLFSPGDTLSQSDLPNLLERSRENLLNTSLFNFVNVTLLLHDFMPVANVRFTFVERWYIWPFPIFEVVERNLNDWIMNPSLKRTNYGFLVVKENFRGRMERISLLARFGYRQLFTFNYSIPYLNPSQTLGLNFTIGYSRRNEIEYLTLDNKQLFYSEEDAFALEQFFVGGSFRYRNGIHHHHNLSLEFSNYKFADSLLVLNPQFSPSNATQAPFFSIGYEFKNDHRDIKAYPLKGYYYDVKIKRQGLGILKNEKMDITRLEGSVRKFWQLSNRWYFASGINAKFSTGNFHPYYLQQGLGFKGDIVRGYENYVVDGQHFGVLKSNFKYNLVPNRVTRIGFLNNEKFSLIHYALYVNFFTDLGYVRDDLFFKGNPYSNNILLGSGVGLDLVTYYDKVFRTEFSFTRHGDLGVYLHLIAPI